MIGKTLGSYEIKEPLGKGGMGEVYRARDTNLDRDVAIKVLPEDFATDPERLARFEREAKLLASLNHANIAAIYGLEDEGDQRFIAMELVEGETLAERISRSGRIDVDEALEIARQIAEALEAAHESGVIHRDLKPANVIVARDGKAKVLDFGLAKAYETDGTASDVSPDLSHSPTMAAATRTGVILGTAAYMSPEQARGRPVDKRTDIWAFGCVLFEMLAGKRAYSGETVSDTMAAILKEEPDFDALPDELAHGTRQLLRRCLDKDPRLRLRDIGEARFWLGSPADDFVSTPTGSDAVAGPISRRLLAAAAVVVVLVAAVSFFGGVAYRDALTGPESPQNLPIATAAGANIGYWYRPVLALSPDGNWLAYVAESRQLYVQDLVGGAPARLIPKSAEAEAPFFSPDSESVAFFQGSTLQTVRVASGEPEEAGRVGISHPGGAWEEDGSKLVVPVFGGPVQRIDPGGEIIHTIESEPGEQFRYPSTLPGGEHFLVSIHTISSRSVVAMSRDGSSRTVVVDGGYYGRYVPTGHILWMRGNELVAASFDLDTLTRGDPEVVARNVVADRREGFGEYGVADDGTIAYLDAEPGGEWLQLLRPGESPETLNSEPLDLAYMQLDVSPKGDLVAYGDQNIPTNIQLFDLTRRTPAGALVSSPDIDFIPLFSPDGTRVTYNAIREDWSWEFRETTVNPPSALGTLFPGGAPKWVGGWSPDEETLTFFQENADSGTDIMLFTPASGEDPRRFVDTDGREDFSVFSADGKWIIYSTNEATRSEIHARAFPAGDDRHVLSSGGGRLVKVANDGSIFFENGEVVMRVDVIDSKPMPFTPAVEFVRGVDSAAWDVLPDGSGVIAVQRRPEPQLRLILGALGQLGKR